MKGRLREWLRALATVRENSLGVRHSRTRLWWDSAVRLLPPRSHGALSPSIAGDLRRGATAQAARAPREGLSSAQFVISAR